VGSLERATARLANLPSRDAVEAQQAAQQAIEERERAIEAIAGWIAAERQASRPVSPELAHHLTRDLEMGAGILVRVAVDREAARIGLAKLGRESQILRRLNNSGNTKTNTIDYQG